MDIQAVESKLNDVTVTAIPMSSVGSKSYHHQNQKSVSAHNYSQSSSSSKSQKNQSQQQQYLNYQQNKLVQSAIQLIQQQQYQAQRQQLLENGVSINSTASHSVNHAPAHAGSSSGSHSYANYGQSNISNGAQLASVMPQSSLQNSGLSKYAQLLAVIEEMGRDIRPTYAMGRGDRLKRLIIQAKVLVRECLMETERSARQ